MSNKPVSTQPQTTSKAQPSPPPPPPKTQAASPPPPPPPPPPTKAAPAAPQRPNQGKVTKTFNDSSTKHQQKPVSKMELEKLKKDAQRDKHEPRPQLNMPGPGGQAQKDADRAAFNQRQKNVSEREKRMSHISERLHDKKGDLKADFDKRKSLDANKGRAKADLDRRQSLDRNKGKAKEAFNRAGKNERSKSDFDRGR